MYLTKRQKEILDFISGYVARQGFAPTLEEIGAHFGLSSPATVYKHVEQLVRKGYLRKAKHQGRGIELVDVDAEQTIRAPVRGRMRAGRMLRAGDSGETVSLPPGFAAGAPLFVVRIEDDDLSDELLIGGDLLIVEERREPREGETVIAVLDNDGTTVGRYFQDTGVVRLGRAAAGRPGVAPDQQISVTGVVVGLLRRYA